MNTGRRDLLKLSLLAVAAAAASIGRTAFAETPAPTPVEAIFNVRNFGATGRLRSNADLIFRAAA